MARSIKLTDSNYWDLTSIAMKRGNLYYSFYDALYGEIQAAREYLSYGGSNVKHGTSQTTCDYHGSTGTLGT